MVKYDLRKLSAPIEALRKEVLEGYNRVDLQWTAVNEELSKLPIPGSVHYIFAEDDEYNYSLQWRKYKGTKRICYVSSSPDLEEENITPYEEWSGKFRVDLIKHVPGLFQSALKTTEEFIANTRMLEVQQ